MIIIIKQVYKKKIISIRDGFNNFFYYENAVTFFLILLGNAECKYIVTAGNVNVIILNKIQEKKIGMNLYS